jgi:hypothetical protein
VEATPNLAVAGKHITFSYGVQVMALCGHTGGYCHKTALCHKAENHSPNFYIFENLKYSLPFSLTCYFYVSWAG